MIKITMLKPLEGTKLKLAFSDGTSGVYDCGLLLSRSGPMVQPLKDPGFFNRVFLESGVPTWPNGYDLAPWALHKELEDAKLLMPASASAVE